MMSHKHARPYVSTLLVYIGWYVISYQLSVGLSVATNVPILLIMAVVNTNRIEGGNGWL